MSHFSIKDIKAIPREPNNNEGQRCPAAAFSEFYLHRGVAQGVPDCPNNRYCEARSGSGSSGGPRANAAKARVGARCRGPGPPTPTALSCCTTLGRLRLTRPASSATSKLHAPEKTSTFEKIPNGSTFSRCKLAITT